MSTGDARRGRRDNGLVAAEYAAAGDVDPRVGEHLLDVLALEGIAAYLRPTTDLHPVTRATWMPDRPIDRLYVDRAHLGTARDYLRQLAADAEPTHAEPTPAGASAPGGTPGPAVGAVPPAVDAESPAAEPDPTDSATAPSGSGSGSGSGSAKGDEPDIDAAWAQIIAGYADEAPEPRVPGILPPTPLDPFGPTIKAELPKPKPTLDVDAPSLLTGFDTFGATLPDEEVEDFTPPPAPPMPRPSLPTVLAVIGIVGGLVIFLSPRIVPLPQALVMLLGFAGIVSGFVTLVWRLRPGGDDDDFDPHHGARV